MNPSEAYAAAIRIMPDETFEKIVRADMMGDPVPLLREPESLDRWVAWLTAAVNDVSVQMSTYNTERYVLSGRVRAGEATQHEYLTWLGSRKAWRRRALDFQEHAVIRLKEAKDLRRRRNIEQADTSANGVRSVLRRLIYEHREASRSAGVHPGPHDLDLWAVLDIVSDEDILVRYGSRGDHQRPSVP